MTRIVVNKCYGGFGLSNAAIAAYAQRIAPRDPVRYWDIKRDDPDLVSVVRELGQAANGSFAKLRIVDIPDDVQWHIAEYDGLEHVAENHRTW